MPPSPFDELTAQTERVVMPDGRVVDRQVAPSPRRPLTVGRVVSTSPLTVDPIGGSRFEVRFKAKGLAPQVGAWLLCVKVGPVWFALVEGVRA